VEEKLTNYFNNINLRYLLETYSPDNVLHREHQINELKNVFKNFKRGIYQNKIVQGVTGSGKSVSIRKVMSEYERITLFSSGLITKTSINTLKALSDSTYHTKAKILTSFINDLKNKPKILVIDEIDKIKDLDFFSQDLNAVYRETQVPIIIITNKVKMLEQLSDDVNRTLLFERIFFPSYTHNELLDILNERLKLCNYNNLPEDTKKYICGYTAKNGSARFMLNFTYKLIIKNKFDRESIEELIKNLESEEWKLWIDSLSNIEKDVLRIMIEVYDSKKAVTNSDIQQKLKNLSPSRISQIVTYLMNEYGIIKSEVINIGRKGGRYRVLKFTSQDTFNKISELI